MKIAMLGKIFINWGGGIDFLKMLINALHGRDEAELTLYLPVPCGVERLKEILRPYKNFLVTLKERGHFSFKRGGGNDLSAIEKNFLSEWPDLTIKRYADAPSSLVKTLLADKIDVVFPSHSTLGAAFPIPWVGYIADFQYKHYPEFFGAFDCARRDKIYARLFNECRYMLATSRYTADEAKRYFPQSRAKMIVAGSFPVPRERWFGLSDVDISGYCLPKRFFLISNQFWAHKDHSTAFRAIALLRNDPRFSDICVVCTGKTSDDKDPSYFKRLTDLIESLNASDAVRFLGYIPKLDQIKILTCSEAVIQPTLFEGGPGGLVSNDAISLGHRVILSDIPVNLEVESELATFFKAGSAEDLRDKMAEILTTEAPVIPKEELIRRGEAARRGLGDRIMALLREMTG